MIEAPKKPTLLTSSRVVLLASSKADEARKTPLRNSGSALLIVLGFIVILAVVLTAFLSNSRRALLQSEASANLLKTQLLGQVATGAIVEDLSDEMRAGADSEPADGEMMQVSQPWAMVPGRVVKDPVTLTDANYVNLVKQSASGQAFFPGNNPATFSRTGKKRASAVSTSVPSRNERVISTERWDRPKLLGGASGLTKFTSTQVPDWILITRSGAVEDASAAIGDVSDKAPSNSDYVLGRFAYNIYRVDGLLDVNVAGFDPSNSAATAKAASKGSLAWADLRAIPGLENDTSVKSLIEWRNKVSNASYPAMVAGLTSTSPPDASPGRWGEPGGFLESYTSGTATDNRFFGRQDLLNYFRHQFGTAADAALPFLTTFSADLDQPSFRPDPNRPKVERSATSGGNDAYGDEAQPPKQQINPPLLAILDGDGVPVVKRRFPLDRLKYLIRNPPVTNRPLIQDYFGLEWKNGAWEYIEGAPIKRLHQLSGTTPNMIQLLKAAITAGSLGGQLNYGEDRATLLKDRDSSIDYQVMRIAACIIDQYDSDSFPTKIRFAGYEINGVEDLPYLYGMRVGSYRQNQLDPTTAVTAAGLVDYPKYASGPLAGQYLKDLYRSVVMIQPILWNPHAPSASADRPTAFRVTADTRGAKDVQPGARYRWWKPGTNYYFDWPSKTGDPRDLSEARSFSPVADYISFIVSQDSAQKASFREPYTLKAPDYPPGSDAKAFTGTEGEFSETTLGPDEQNDTSAGENSTKAIGFRTGWVWSGPWVNTSTPTYLQEGRVFTAGIDFALQYQSSMGEWITYDSYDGFTNAENFRLDRYTSGAAAVNPRQMRYYLRTDPRVDRYGTRAPLHYPYRKTASEGIPQGSSLRPDDSSGVHATQGWPDPAEDFNFTVPATNTDRLLGLLSENKASSALRYEDPDGVRRLAMGGFSSGMDGLPMATGNYASRPVVLNRPFRSVAELGNVLRDQPWKQLDFFSPESGDAALLDLFCIYEPEDVDAEPIVAGRVNLNSSRPEVIESLLRGVDLIDGSPINATASKTLAEDLVDWTANADPGKGPLRNRSELIGKFVSGTTYSGFSSTLTDVLTGANRAIPLRRQNVLRALVEPGTTRSWTFLIDLVVQDGQFLKPGANARDFVVRGEKRYWVHLSMDRFTGKVISERVEEVYE